MDNLEKLWCHSVTTDEATCGETISCSYAEDIACFITDRNFLCTYQHHKLTSHGAAARISDNGKLKRVHYLSYYDNIFASTDFDFYIFGRHTFQVKFVFVTPKAISELCWNPTETTVAVTYDSDEIALFDFSGCSFKAVYIADLHTEVCNSVYLGWGARNVQFQAPVSQAPVEEEKNILLSDEPPKIVWSSQGSLVAVNFQKNGKRFIKVFDKELNALAMTEEYTNLGRTLSFMTLGQAIASSAVRNNMNYVVIFENTCKVKSTFAVPENKGVIKKLEYHPHMNMLAVYSIDEKSFGYINIYLNVNEKWSLKNQLPFPPTRVVRDFQWVIMPEAAYTICKICVFTSRNIEYHTFRFIVNRCPRSSVVASIDGKTIEFYDFTRKVLPPPMRLCTLNFARPLIHILFHPQLSIAVVLDSKLQAYLVDMQHYAKLFCTDDLNLTDIATFHDVEWGPGNNIKVNIAYNGVDYPVTTKDTSRITLKINTFAIQNPHYVLPYNDTEALISHRTLADHLCALMYLTRKKYKVEGADTTFDFALSSNHEFYVNERLLYCGMSSIMIFRTYLLFTTIHSKLYCVRLLENTSLFDKELDLSTLYSRDIEQGARIICATNGQMPQITLHIPRGNLETIYCKLMAVDIVEMCLILNNWKSAINLMRAAKLNWNVLVDLNPKRFISHIPDFAQAAEHCSILGAIVNDLGNTDDTTYLTYMPKTTDTSSDKNDIIQKILVYLISKNCVENLITLVSVQQKHFTLKAAVNSIKDVFMTKTAAAEKVCKKALQFLLVKGRKKDILNATYTLYNLDFLKFVYHSIGEDPIIFEPEIARLSELESLDMRFQMSLRAKNLEIALKYLIRCILYDEVYVEAFIVKYKLEAYAYTTFPIYTRHYELIGHLYAKQLSSKKLYSEAAFVLKRVQLIPEALEEYKKALDWMEVLVILNQLGYEEDEKKDILDDLAQDLIRARRLDEAILLIEHYNRDYEKAIQILVEHKAFKKAVGLARLYGATNMLEDIIIPRIERHMTDLDDKFNDFRVTFEKYLKRLKIVRENRKMSLDNEGPGEPDDPACETASTVTGSTRTSRTRASSMSSRNRRKEERKKIDLREGGHYEDIALIRALYLLYSDVFLMGPELSELCLILEHNQLPKAKLLHDKLLQLQEDMRREIPEIWPEALLMLPDVVDNYMKSVVQNKADLDPKYWTPPPKEILNAKWKLEMFSTTR